MGNNHVKKITFLKVALVVCATAHVCEEYFGGFVAYIDYFFPGVTAAHFIVFNALFLLYMFALFLKNNVLIVSIPILLLINAAIHMSGLIVFHKYNPGVVTAAMLYVPVSLVFLRTLKPPRFVIKKSLLVAAAVMSVPLLFQLIRLFFEK